jgi:Flp pilus assembly pilin Flp
MSPHEVARERTAGELGQTFVEYALILAVVVVGVLLTVTWTGLEGVIQAAMDTVAGAI